MSKLVALEWDAREARLIVSRRRGKDLVLEQAFAVDLRAQEGQQNVRVGERIQAALAARSVGKADLLVSLGRANIELRSMALPPVPTDELPDLVRFQAQRQFTSIGENWPLDFVPLTTNSEGVTVLAAAISPELLQAIRDNCQAAELTPRRLVLRPFAAAAAWRQAAPDPRCSLMVDLLADEADLTVLADGLAVLPRTTRLTVSEDSEDQSRAILGEIKRTIAAAHNQLSGRRVERVIVCGGTADYVRLREQIEKQLSLAVEVFDPFVRVETAPEFVRPENVGRYAPLVGLLVSDAKPADAIDFLQPRRRPKRTEGRRRWMLAAAAAGTLAVGIAGWIGIQISGLNGEIDRLRKEAADLDKSLKSYDRPTKHAEQLKQFTDGDIVWLEELRHASEKLPSAEEAIVTQMSAGSAPSGPGGQMLLEGFVRDASQVEELERKLRDDRRRVQGTGSQEDPKQDKYRWRFKETVDVAKPE